jgi:hypothetical protein
MQIWLDMMKKIKPEPLSLIAPEEIEWYEFPDMSKPDSSCTQTKAYPFVKKYPPEYVNCF